MQGLTSSFNLVTTRASVASNCCCAGSLSSQQEGQTTHITEASRRMDTSGSSFMTIAVATELLSSDREVRAILYFAEVTLGRPMAFAALELRIRILELQL